MRANLIWLGKKPFVTGRDYKLKLGTAALPVRIHKINKVIDASRGRLDRWTRTTSAATTWPTWCWRLQQPVAFDLIADCEATGRFVIVDGYDVAGGGIIIAAVADDQRRPARRGAACATSTGSRAA